MVGHGGGASEAAAMPPADVGVGKRGRGPEEDVYVDNLHSHKRYLSEIMASSMNGLSVGDSVADNTRGSPVRPETVSCFSNSRNEMIMQYSPTSEESEDYCTNDTQINTSENQTDMMSSPSTSPISSPNRFQKAHTGFSYGNPHTLPSCSLSAVASSNVLRGTEHEDRIPSSPNDMCHGGDLRRTALLRSVQMRVQRLPPSDFLFGTEHDREQDRGDEFEHKDENSGGVELEHRSCPKSIQDVEFGQHTEHDVDFVKGRPDYDTTSSMFNHNDISSELYVNVDQHR